MTELSRRQGIASQIEVLQLLEMIDLIRLRIDSVIAQVQSAKVVQLSDLSGYPRHFVKACIKNLELRQLANLSNEGALKSIMVEFQDFKVCHVAHLRRQRRKLVGRQNEFGRGRLVVSRCPNLRQTVVSQVQYRDGVWLGEVDELGDSAMSYTTQLPRPRTATINTTKGTLFFN